MWSTHSFNRWSLALLALLALILFPFGWLAEVWSPLGIMLGWIFATAREHAIGHSALFFLLGLALLIARPELRARPWRFLALVLLAGIAQELFQLLYKQRPLALDDARDIFTDLIGAGLAFLSTMWWTRRAAPHSPQP